MDRKLLDSITVSLSTILLIVGIEQYVQEALYDLAVPMILIGGLVLILGKKIIKDFNSNILKRVLTNSVGLMLLVLGFEYFFESMAGKHAWLYIIIAIAIYHYHNEIAASVL